MKKLFIITALLMYSGCSLRFPDSDMDTDTISDGNTYSDNACPQLTGPANGSVTVSGYALGNTAEFSCNTNYTLKGSSETIACSISGWVPTPPTCQCDWAYRREITVTGGEADLQLLVVLPTDFNFSNAGSNGEDIRFSTDSTGSSFDLSHYIESWADGKIWVKLNSDASTIYIFYGNESASDTSVSFSTMFPDSGYWHLESGSVTLYEDVTYDYVYIESGAVLRLDGAPVQVKADKIILEGRIAGTGRGYQWADPPSSEGQGDYEFETLAGGGGGGYGGKGGDGGSVSHFSPGGEGGAIYGLPYDMASIEMGASGGIGYDNSGSGGDGGGAIWLDAQEIIVSGTIEMTGAAGTAYGGYDGGGGGSGGGILLTGNYVTVTSAAELEAKGGSGGTPTGKAGGGGGGGGGRIKIGHDSYYLISSDAAITVSGGTAGTGGDDPEPEDGISGTTALDEEIVYEIKADVDERTKM